MANIIDVSRHLRKAIIAPPGVPRIFDQPKNQ
jgi:hypothetical protein